MPAYDFLLIKATGRGSTSAKVDACLPGFLRKVYPRQIRGGIQNETNNNTLICSAVKE